MNVHRNIRTSIPAIVATGVLLAACEGKGASARSAEMPAKTNDSASTAAAAGSSSAQLSDANIVALLDAANAGDSTLGAEALAVATSKDAKNFARMMMGEHHALRVKGEKLAKTEMISAAMPADNPFAAAVDGERQAVKSATRGHGVDSTYIAQEIGIHSAVISWATTAEAQAQNKELKSLIQSAGPVLKKHLDQAMEIQRKLVR